MPFLTNNQQDQSILSSDNSANGCNLISQYKQICKFAKQSTLQQQKCMECQTSYGFMCFGVYTLIICSSTPSSVCGPMKHPQITSTTRSIILLPGDVLSIVLPDRCPQAISFCTHQPCLSIQLASVEMHSTLHYDKIFKKHK